MNKCFGDFFCGKQPLLQKLFLGDDEYVYDVCRNNEENNRFLAILQMPLLGWWIHVTLSKVKFCDLQRSGIKRTRLEPTGCLNCCFRVM